MENSNWYRLKNIKIKQDISNKEVLKKACENMSVELNEEIIHDEIHRMIHQYSEQMRMQGISLEVYYQFTNSSEKDLKAQLEKEAYSNVLYRLMLEEIMTQEKIEVTEEEADKEATELAEKYQMEKEEFLNQFGGLEMIQYDLEMRKVMELLKELNK